jgi:eukaryotic-like serine/threonine-protein kinase
VVLLDFGLVTEVTEAATRSASSAGTPMYVAPEQQNGHASESSDLYALGMLVAASLRARRAAGKSYPRELETLSRQLTNRNPSSRPAYTQLMAALVAADRSHRLVCCEPNIRRVSVVGRSAELDVLSNAFERSRRRPVVVVVRGESGTGKTALLDELATQLSSALVLRGRCHERESLPFKALDGVVDALSQYLVSLPDAMRRMLWCGDREALVAAFPVLGRLEARREPCEVPARELRLLADQLRDLMRRLALARPVVLLLDDVHSSDCRSGDLLASVLCHHDAPSVLVVMTEGRGRGPSPAISAFTHVAQSTMRPIELEEIALSPRSRSTAIALPEPRHTSNARARRP